MYSQISEMPLVLRTLRPIRRADKRGGGGAGKRPCRGGEAEPMVRAQRALLAILAREARYRAELLLLE